MSALIQRRQAHEMEDSLSAVSEAVAEVTGPPSSKMPAGAEAPGSEGMIDSPGRTVRRNKNKGSSRNGPGRLERCKRQALIRQSQGGLCKGRPEGNRSHPGAPPVRAVLWRGVGSGLLTSGGTVYRHIFLEFSGIWGARGTILSPGGNLFGYVAGLLSTIGCLEGHSVKPVEVAAMREVCRVRGWEIPSEFSLNPPNSPAVLIHWRALIELLGLMPAPRRVALCSLRWSVVGGLEVQGNLRL